MQEQQFITLGNRIRLRRKELGLSQSKLAESLDISNNHMSAIENGREKPSMDKFIHICDLLKTTPDFLLLGSIHPNNIPLNICDNLRLCSSEDIKLAGEMIELMVARNQHNWNKNKF